MSTQHEPINARELAEHFATVPRFHRDDSGLVVDRPVDPLTVGAYLVALLSVIGVLCYGALRFVAAVSA